MFSHFLLSDTLGGTVFVKALTQALFGKKVFSKFRRFFLQIFFGPSFKEILIAKKISKSALGKRVLQP